VQLTIRSGPDTGRSLDLTGRVAVGREDGCELVLDDEKASRVHAAFVPNPDGTVTLEDLGSTNGTYLAGRRIAAPVVLTGGERVQIGDTVLELAVKPASAPTPSRLERIQLGRSARRTQVIAAIAGAGVLAAILVGVLFGTGVVGGDDERKPSVAEVVQNAKASTVQVRGIADGKSQGSASGWVYDAGKGLVVTDPRIVDAASQFAVRLGDEQRDRPAELVGIAPCEGLAVIRVEDASGMVTMPLGSQTDLRQGDDVVALGYPFAASEEQVFTASAGVVSVVRTKALPTIANVPPLANVVQSDAKTNAGAFGGPLVTLDNELAGATYFRTSGQGIEGQSFAVGVDRVKQLVPQLAAGRSIGWPGIGTFPAPTAEQLESIGLPGAAGVLITNVLPGTPAAAAGIPAPSLIVAVDGKPLDGTLPSYCAATGGHSQGESMTLSLIPAGSDQPVDVQVAAA
jgi:S1-C subfamily serine protease